MSMSIQIPTELQSLFRQAVARGDYANEQELVTEILTFAAPALENYQRLRERLRDSIEDEQAGRVRCADFEAVRQRLRDELDDDGQPA